MEIRQLLTKLKEQAIDVSLSGENLEIAYDGELNETVLQEIRDHKPAIISFLTRLSANSGVTQAIPVIEQQDSYVLSSSQRRLWILGQFDDANMAYNEQGFYEFSGNLHVAAFERAFESLVERHEILRTVFRADDSGEVRQIIHPASASGVRLAVVDLSRHPDAHAAAHAILIEEMETRFDLHNGPLLRSHLLKMSETQFVFGYVMHHIISDGWSLEVMIGELMLLYNAYSEGRGNPLTPLRIQYKDYAAWQQAQISGDNLRTHKDYWLGQLQGELPVLGLQGDRTRPAIKTYNGNRLDRMLNSEITSGMRRLVNAEGATLFMGLLATVNALLYKYTSQEDFIVGTVVAGRDHADLEDQIGCYLNTLALRTRFTGDQDFSTLLQQVKEVTLGAYDHQVYQFDDLISELQVKHDPSRSVLFDVSVVLQNTGVSGNTTKSLGDIAIKPYLALDYPISKFDLSFNFEETGDNMLVLLFYNTDVYSKALAERLLDHLEQLMISVIASPQVALNQLAFLTPVEKERLLETFNKTDEAYPLHKTMVQLFEEQVAQTPENCAFVFDDNQLSYAALNQRANQLADYLRKSYSILPDDVVGVQLKRSEWMLISILGILKAGGAYLPIDPDYPQDRIDFMITDSGCKVVIDGDELEAFIMGRSKYSRENPAPANKPTDLAYVIYTSGSTGKPKGVMIEHASLINLCFWHRNNFELTEKDRAGLYAGTSFDASVWEIFPYIISGACLYLVPEEVRLDMYGLNDYFEANGISITFLPTSIGEQFFDMDNQSLRYLLVGGEKLNTTVPCNYQVVNNYGPTEATVVTTSIKLSGEQTNPPIGYPVSNFQLYITGNNGELLPEGAVGEICIAGAGLARGYLHNPELTAEKFIPNPFSSGGKMYRTGDLGRWLPDGSIAFMGRKDNQVKIRGYRIELAEVENALRAHESITAIAVVARADAKGDNTLVAYFTGTEMLAPQELRAFMRNAVPDFMIPEYFMQLPVLPLTANGKLDKHALPDPEGMLLSGERRYVPPRDETDRKLVAIWEELLGHDNIGIADNFFDIGGNSLKATRLISKINKVFQLEVDLRSFFEDPTIMVLADKINNDLWFKGAMVNAGDDTDDNYEEIKI
jgi:tyrocidine synthetase III